MTVTNLKERNTVSKFQEGVQKSFINTGTAPDTSVTSDSVVFTEYVIHQTCGSVPFIPPGSKCTNETENNNAELLSSNTENIIELFSDANIDDALDFFENNDFFPETDSDSDSDSDEENEESDD